MRSRPEIELRTLNVLVAVVEAQGMTAAANRLNMSQSAISQTINNLEQELGVKLIDRTIRPLTLTRTGEILYDEAKILLEKARQITRKVRDPIYAATPNIRIGMTASLTSTIGVYLLKAHKDAAKSLSLWSGTHSMHLDSLIARELDIIIIPDSHTNFDGMEHVELIREPFILALPKRYCGDFSDLQNISRNLDFIRHPPQSLLSKQIDAHLRRCGIEPPKTYELDSPDSVLAMVASSAGWAITTPLCAMKSNHYLEKIRYTSLPGAGYSRRIIIVARRNEYSDLIHNMASTICHIMNKIYLPDIKTIVPWCFHDIKVCTPLETSPLQNQSPDTGCMPIIP